MNRYEYWCKPPTCGCCPSTLLHTTSRSKRSHALLSLQRFHKAQRSLDRIQPAQNTGIQVWSLNKLDQRNIPKGAFHQTLHLLSVTCCFSEVRLKSCLVPQHILETPDRHQVSYTWFTFLFRIFFGGVPLWAPMMCRTIFQCPTDSFVPRSEISA